MSNTDTDKVLIAPSILAADWSNLAFEAAKLEEAGADWIHVDVMDGHFVPPITFGPQMVKALKKCSKLPLDVHLMIEQPERQLEAFAEAGASVLTVHVEACPHLHRTVQQIKELGVQAGVALNPATPLAAIEQILPELDLLLVMSVNPGWGGQKFIDSSLDKLRRARQLIQQTGKSIRLEVDGGVNDRTTEAIRDAGARVLVAGSYVFEQPDCTLAVTTLRGGANR